MGPIIALLKPPGEMKDVFQSVGDTSTLGKNKNPSAPNRSQTYDLRITSSVVANPLNPTW